MRILAVIPARLGSTRFPRKVLADIHGKPMLAHVYERAVQCEQFDQVIVATDSDEIAKVCQERGTLVAITGECRNGTERVADLAERYPDYDTIVNIQGDEPLFDPAHVAKLLKLMRKRPKIDVATLAASISVEEAQNKNRVKVVCDKRGRALYFSRAPIPYNRECMPHYRAHIGMYAFTWLALQSFLSLPPSPLESAESLEQLRFLENGIPIHVVDVDHAVAGVDTADDLLRVRSLMAGSG